MKLIKILLSGFTALCLLAGCESDLDIHNLSSESSFVAPVLNQPGEIKVTSDMIENEAEISFGWTKADFGQPVEIVYNINASYNGKSTVLFAKLNGSSYSVKCPELAEKLLNLGIPAGQTVTMTMNIDCTIGNDFKTLKSADKTISVFVE